jgi:hypothetical protein
MISVCALLLLFHPTAGSSQDHFPFDPEKVGRPVICPFPTTVELRYLPTGTSLPTPYQLFEKSGTHWTVLNDIQGPQGKVRVQNGREALAFARLTTSIDLATAADAKALVSYCEILPRTKLTLEFCFGSKEMLKMLSDGTNAFFGVVPLAWFQKERLSLPRVKRTGSTWTNTRHVLRRKGYGHSVLT